MMALEIPSGSDSSRFASRRLHAPCGHTNIKLRAASVAWKLEGAAKLEFSCQAATLVASILGPFPLHSLGQPAC
jgi:hypothetical protein